MKENILVINPGSTSTKIAIFNQEGKDIFKETISHSVEEFSQFKSLLEQGPVRKKIILDTLKKKNIETDSLKAIIGRGGVLKPLKALKDCYNYGFGEGILVGDEVEIKKSISKLGESNFIKEIISAKDDEDKDCHPFKGGVK